MAIISINNNLGKFWEKTPTMLKYILVFAVLVAVSYFVFSKRVYDTQMLELKKMETGIELTYELINHFEVYKVEQSQHNREVLNYLTDLHTLIIELNITTNRKIDMILSSGDHNTDLIIEKLLLLNESFEKLSRAYGPNINERIEKENDIDIDIGMRKRDTIK